MRDVIYLMNLSLDGFVEGRDGKFGWAYPDDEVHQFHNDTARDMGAFLYGRRMYETMAGWQTADTNPSSTAVMLEFARIWKEKPKIVFSSTLRSVGENCRLVREDIGIEVSTLKKQPGGPLSVSGPGLAASLARLGLIDEYRLVFYPVLAGGGKPYFPGLSQTVHLRLLETRAFRCGAVYLRYRAA
jgi:dihydrofolate reductase